MVTQTRLRLALIGLGRLGTIRARILAFQQPRIELVAVCDTKPGASEWAATNLPANVEFFASPEDCMKNSGADAVLISTATATHASLICQALDLDLHVMCEKPISIDLIETEEVLEKAAAKPHLTFLVPFSRRYDDSYRAAKLLAQNGSLGDVHAVETSCLDQQDPTGFFVTFSAQSGGVFVDMGVHDVDVGRWFLDVDTGLTNPRKQVNRVVAMGQQAVYGDLAKFGDCDNGWGMVEFANGKILTTHLGRTLTNGFEGGTRLCGTKAHSVINGYAATNRIEIRDCHGIRTTTTPDAFVLYDKTFVNDLAEFASAVLDDVPLTCTPDDAYEAGKIASALQHSFRIGQPVYFDDSGLPIMKTAKVNGYH